MKMFKRMMAATAIVIFGFTLYACGSGGVSASDTLSAGQTAAVQSLIDAAVAPIKTQLGMMKVQVVTTKTAVRSSRKTESVGSSTASPQGTVSSGNTVIGTFEGYVNYSGSQLVPSLQTNSAGMGILSPQGYMAYSTTDGRIFPQPDLFYATNDCSLNPYLYTVGGSNGLTFRSGDTLDASVADASTYWAIAPGQTPVAVTFYSEQLSPGNCVTLGGVAATALKAVPNDYSVTGFLSASQGSLAQSGP